MKPQLILAFLLFATFMIIFVFNLCRLPIGILDYRIRLSMAIMRRHTKASLVIFLENIQGRRNASTLSALLHRSMKQWRNIPNTKSISRGTYIITLSLSLSTCISVLLYCISLHTYTVPNPYYVSHSLGGGVASLFAFHLAHMKKQNQNVCKNFVKRITAVTWAAPIVGNAEFAKMYNTLEEEGYLRQ